MLKKHVCKSLIRISFFPLSDCADCTASFQDTLLLQDYVYKTSICISFLPLSDYADHTTSFPVAKLSLDDADHWYSFIWYSQGLQLHLSLHQFGILQLQLTSSFSAATRRWFHQNCSCTYCCIDFGSCNCDSLPSSIPSMKFSQDSWIFPMMPCNCDSLPSSIPFM